MRARNFFYYNLHASCWSRRLRGKVEGYVQAAELMGVEFRVQPAGRARVLREQRKNVHAFAAAMHFTLIPDGRPSLILGERDGWVEVSYNPYHAAHFYRKDTGAPVVRAARVILTADRKVFAKGLTPFGPIRH